MVKLFLGGCGAACALVLSIQLYLSAALNGEGVEPATLSDLNLSLYAVTYQPLQVCLTLSMVSLVVFTVLAVTSRGQISRGLSWMSPLIVTFCYLLSLTFFVISHQLYMNPDFRTSDYRIDPFQLFLIPFVLSAIFLVFPITVITGLIILLKPRMAARS